MIRDITIGQYYPCSSVIHSLDPRLKIVGTLVYMVSLFLFDTFYGFLLTGGFFVAVLLLSHVSFKYVLRGMKPIMFILLFTMFFNIILTPGEELFHWGILTVTKEGLRTAGFMGLRLALLVLGSSLMTFTTTPNRLTDGMERLMRPLKLIRVPVHEIAMMLSIALRFIPILLEETDKIMKAQQARGADFESGNIIKRAKALVPIIIPLFVSAFRRAGELSLAMEARCYHGGKGRTRMKPLRYAGRDVVAYLALALYLGGVIVFRVLVEGRL